MEWIDSGSLVERVNFVANQLSNVQHSGVRRIIDRLAAERVALSRRKNWWTGAWTCWGQSPSPKKPARALVEFASSRGR